MKKPILLLFILTGFLCSTNAQNFEGTWKGTMMQDSPVVRIDFEMVLEQKEGKISGYLYRLFIVNDSLIYNTVRVTARVSDNVLIVEDDESVSRNFEERANRKIKAAYFFKLNPKLPVADTLYGEWTTSRFKKYMAMSGKVSISREVFYETTQLFKRLEEKQLHTTIAFVPKRTAPDVAINKPKQETSTSNPPAPETKPTPPVPVKQNNNVASNQPKTTPVVNNNASPKKDTIQTAVVVNKPPVTNPQTSKQPTVKPSTKPAAPDVAINKPIKPQVQTNAPVKNNQQPVLETKPAQQPTVAPPTEKPKADIALSDKATVKDSAIINQKPTAPGAPPVINNPVITKRETEVIQALEVFEDSVTLSLYDNGEIDGDTVSVFLNNEKIISNVRLTASAYKHTIYFKKGETIQLTLYAENLGTIPPNSGLLVVYSGDKRYQVFFTSTLNKSAVILLKRE
jgi:hypothetical protein